MSLTDSGSNLIMPVAPTGGGFGGGFGGGWGDGIWLILLVLFAIGGNGFGFGGFGGGGLAADGAMLYPWMNQANQTAEGFQNQLMKTTSLRFVMAFRDFLLSFVIQEALFRWRLLMALPE